MSKIGKYVMELQEQGVLLPENPTNAREPDFMDYARDYMATPEYAIEHNEQEQRIVDGFLDSVNNHGGV